MKNTILVVYKRLFDTGEIKWSNLELMASRLSELANRNRPWTAKFLHSLLKEHEGFKDYHNEALALSLQLLAHELDGGGATAMIISRSIVVVSTPLPPGTIIQGEVRRCQCGLWFVPRWHSQKYHDKRCKSKARYLRRKNIKEKNHA